MGLEAYATSAVLPFDKPSTASLRSSSKKVFANWVVSLPVSLDNLDPSVDYYTKQYLDPDGESGKHRAYGGYLRDRPLGRAPRSGDWRLEDLKTEVRQAISVGIDGFTMVIYSMPSNPTSTVDNNWNTARLMMQAAAEVDPGFKIIPMPDMTALDGITQDKLATNLAYLATFPSIYRLADGRAVISPFYAEIRTVDFWSGWLSKMTTNNSTPTALWPTFLNEQGNIGAFGSTIVGAGNWGSRTPESNPTGSATGWPKWRIQQAHNANKLWMQPVSIQDDRPREGKFVEARNLQNLRNTWDIAIDGGADWVQLITWNDLPESSGILPSLRHGWTYLDLMAYYITWFKTGSAPKITTDAIYLTHRGHFADDRPSFPQTIISENRGGTPSRDAIEAMVFLTAPGTVTIKAGSTSFDCAAPAGMSLCVAPLAVGTVSAEVRRQGALVSSVISRTTVTHTPYVQDLQYVGSSSLREGYTASQGPSTTPSSSGSVSLRPVADTYADQNAPDKEFSWSSQIMARGTKDATGYLRFDVPNPPAGTTLTSATLKMRTTTATEAGSVDPATVARFNAGWNENSLTWNNRPIAPITTVGTFPANTVPDTAYDITLSKNDIAAAQGTSLNLAILSNSADNLRLWSTAHQSPTVWPELVLTYTPTSPAAPGSTSLRPVADTYADQNAPDREFSWSSQIMVRGGARHSVGYLRFNLPNPPAGTTLASATLKMRTTTAADAGSSAPATVASFAAAWSEASVTWNTRPIANITTRRHRSRQHRARRSLRDHPGQE